LSTIRAFAILTLVLLAAYFGLRVVATQCSGPRCDTYFIAPSLLLPLLILVVAAVTGILAITAARQGAQGAWAGALSACTLLGVLGPVVSLAIWRNSPDQFVLAATLLVLLVPLSALIFSVTASRLTHS
jgi:heme/copper-type cytochrome/quinol oxidase subunit 3